MAEKDVAVGWGTLQGGLAQWCCPVCKVYSDVLDWKQGQAVINQRRLDSRVCPKCGYNAATLSDTDAMREAHRQEKKKRVAHEAVKPERVMGGQKV